MGIQSVCTAEHINASLILVDFLLPFYCSPYYFVNVNLFKKTKMAQIWIFKYVYCKKQPFSLSLTECYCFF